MSSSPAKSTDSDRSGRAARSRAAAAMASVTHSRASPDTPSESSGGSRPVQLSSEATNSAVATGRHLRAPSSITRSLRRRDEPFPQPRQKISQIKVPERLLRAPRRNGGLRQQQLRCALDQPSLDRCGGRHVQRLQRSLRGRKLRFGRGLRDRIHQTGRQPGRAAHVLVVRDGLLGGVQACAGDAPRIGERIQAGGKRRRRIAVLFR